MSDQGDEWMWASDWASDHDSFGNSVAPKPRPLPLCECGQEVKAGEDQCWTCLGEEMEQEDVSTYYSKKLLERLVTSFNV